MKRNNLLMLMVFGVISVMANTLNANSPLEPSPKFFTGKSLKAQYGSKGQISINAQSSHLVDFVLDYDETTQFASTIAIVNDTVELWSERDYGVELQKGSNPLSLPEGVFDILVFMHDIDPIRGGKSRSNIKLIIREQVSIDQDMQLTFSANEAKNHIHFELLNPQGEPVKTDKVFYDENFNLTVLEAGNITNGDYFNYISSSNHGPIYGTSARFGQVAEGAWQSNGLRSLADFYVNDVSDRFSFYSHQVAWKGDEAFNAAYEVAGVSDNITITNEPENFKLFENPIFAPGHESELIYPIIIKYEFLSDFIGSTFFMETLQPLSSGTTFKYYLGASVEDSPVGGFIPCIIPGVCIMNDDYEEVPQMFSTPMTLINGTITLATNGLASFINNLEPAFYADFSDIPDEQGRPISMNPFWPTHPIFSYPIEKAKGTFGNNCPVLVSNPLMYKQSDNHIYEFQYDYIGRFGEERQECRDKSQINIKLNGTDFYNGEGTPFFMLNELPVGMIDATITNDHVTVDEIKGSNNAQLHYHAGSEDQNPPTMTMMHFKNETGDVTDRFTTAADGTIEFSAGDFNFISTSSTEYVPNFYRAYLRFAPELVEVSYSAYGEDNWNELPIEEVPENYWPVMGWFYRGSLAGVTGEALKGWFDLKVKLTDAAGNWQEQVLSPAFRIDDLAYSSVATVIPASKSGDSAIYNLAGQRMRGDLNTLPHGIYIVNGKKVVK